MDLEGIELGIELKALRNEIKKKEAEIARLVKVIKENDLEDEIEGITELSDEEIICIEGLKNLKPLFENGTFSKDDCLMFDTLHKNLRAMRGGSVIKKKKKMSPDDIKKALKIVGSDK